MLLKAHYDKQKNKTKKKQISEIATLRDKLKFLSRKFADIIFFTNLIKGEVPVRCPSRLFVSGRIHQMDNRACSSSHPTDPFLKIFIRMDLILM